MRSSRDCGEILVVDDSEATLEVIQRNLVAEGYSVRVASGVVQATEILAKETIDLVVTDIKMPRISGLDLVRHVRENFNDVEVIVITGYPTVGGAVTAMKTGALEYLSKPFTDAELLTTVRRAMQRLKNRRLAAGQSGGQSDLAPPGLIGCSLAMQRVFDGITRAARTRATVLVTGESGTGKELVARAVHHQSSRASAQFVPINCGSIPQDLLEAQLFGHVKGAFTGATSTRAGFFLMADGGTVFLDEIGDTTPAMQVKLLRVLQEGEVCMVGSSRPRTVDVRVIAATNKNIEYQIRKGNFREDLYFRLNVISMEIPPLRERSEDVPALLYHFCQKAAVESGCDPIEFSDRALNELCGYGWPGNVRELENIAQRLTVMSDRRFIDVPDLPSLMRFAVPSGSDSLNRTLAEVEAAHIAKVLASVGGNKTRAARILDIDRKTLRTKMKVAEQHTKDDDPTT